MVQRTQQLPWKTTGTIGRLAHPNKVVTNYHSQGTPLALDVLLKSYLKEPEMQEYSRILEELGVKIAMHLQNTFPGFREIGVDVGLDPKLHPWILEVNTLRIPHF